MTQHINAGDDDSIDTPSYCGEHCECSAERAASGSLTIERVCLEPHPTEALGCTRPGGHDGPHSACGSFPHPEFHPIDTWGGDSE